MYPIYRRCVEEAIVDTAKEFYRVLIEYEYEKLEDGDLELKVLDFHIERVTIEGGDLSE